MTEPSGGSRVVWIGAAFYAALALVSLGVGALLGVAPLRTWQWSAGSACAGAAASLPLVLAYVLLMRSRVPWLVRVQRFLLEQLRPLLANASVTQLTLLAVLAGLGEELLFRGLLQQALDDGLGWPAGLTLASVVFGVSHWITPGYALVAGLMGACLGGLYLATGNLLAPVTLHALYDAVALVLLTRADLSRWPAWPGRGRR